MNGAIKPGVLVGMSGGVDSSVAAALLVKRGFRVVGGFIKNWSDSKDLWTGECAWRGERRDAMRVAATLGIPLLTFDFEDAYRKRVVDPMFRAYRSGVTPNPDVLCNQEIKFGLFFREMKRLKLDAMATGHYARIRLVRGAARLLRGLDPDKDQSYFLHRVEQAALRRTMFPVGALRKPDVRRIARTLGLATAEKEESMGICFIGKQNMATFLRTRIPSRPGDVTDPNGNIVGRHEGLDGVTIGQRHGFRVRVPGGPWYAAAKDPNANCLVVVQGREHPLLYSARATVVGVHWIAGKAPTSYRGLSAAVRYRQGAVPALVKKLKGGRLMVEFRKPVFAVAPGQSCVLYRGAECLGGGVIKSAGSVTLES